MRDTGVDGVQALADESLTEEEPIARPLLDFDPWYRKEFRPVVALVYSLCRNSAAAEELAQDAFVEAHKRWNRVGVMADPGAWVRKVAMNRARSRYRRMGAEARAYARHLGRRSEQLIELDEPADEFWSAVRDLPHQQARVVALRYLEDRSIDEIASLLDVAPPTVRVHLHRGRRTLAARFGLEHPDD